MSAAFGRIMMSAGVTTAGAGGAIAAVFLSVGLWLSGMGFATPGSTGRPMPPWFIAAGVTTVLLPPFVGGALWGWGTARLFGRATRPAMRTGSLAFGGMILLTAAPTDVTQLWLDSLPGWMPLGVHGYFTIVFMVEVAVVASVASWRLAKRLGVGESAWNVGVWTGAGASAGFLLGSIVAFSLDIRVLPWVHLSMVWAFLIALPFSTALSGAVLGWRLNSAVEPIDKKFEVRRTEAVATHRVDRG